jgi:hypothetical protein
VHGSRIVRDEPGHPGVGANAVASFEESKHALRSGQVYPSMVDAVHLFVWTYQQNQQLSSSIFLSQQTSKQCFQHNKPAKRTGRGVLVSAASLLLLFFLILKEI